ncbi:hypothetical protein ACOME3_009490 [Neoechinorhynchus agilis]
MSCKRRPKDDQCIYLSSGAMDGTPCDKTMWCQQGRCVPHRRAVEQCLWGDAVHDCYRIRGWNNKTHNPSILCSDPHVKAMCCETCREKEAKLDDKKEQIQNADGCPGSFTKLADMCLAVYRKPRNHSSAARFCKHTSPPSKLLYFDNYQEFQNAENQMARIIDKATQPLIWLGKRSIVNFRSLGSVEELPNLCPGISVKRLSIEKTLCTEKNMMICRFS